ncbi:MAG: class I SAM-dependent methyltransferase [Rubellimicrobium sp.]|nr:class I SAM-dependent methyltransferase [Rubellimicrobium sp.]
MSDQVHWDDVYGARPDAALTWFEDRPDLSMSMIGPLLGPDSRVVDIGGGASRLVDAVLAAGVAQICVLDLSGAALAVSRARLGDRSDQVTWIVADVTRWTPPTRFDVWHDRAVFHFLTEPADRAAYVATLLAALAPAGHALIATFAEDGPERCSGLPVVRYTPDALAAEVGHLSDGALAPVSWARHTHVTPKGNRQNFQYSLLRRHGG